MATTKSNFVYVTGSNPILNGAAVSTPPFLITMNPKEAMSICMLDQVAGGSGAAAASNSSILDRVLFDPALDAIPNIGSPPAVAEVYGNVIGAFAKNGAAVYTLSSTTPQTVDFTDLTANSPTAYAGDTTFSNVNLIIINNFGTQDLTLAPGGSNPASWPKFTGTTPTIALPKGSIQVYHSAAVVTVDSTHKTLTITPTAGGKVSVTVCGS